jgi:hypothetical protein
LLEMLEDERALRKHALQAAPEKDTLDLAV